MVRAGRNSANINDFLNNGIAAVDWAELGPIDPGIAASKIHELYREVYPGKSIFHIKIGVRQLTLFINELSPGDMVATYDTKKRIYYLGDIRSNVLWTPNIIHTMPRARKVSWTHIALRKDLSGKDQDYLGFAQTVFRIKDRVARELVYNSVLIDIR